MTVSANHSLLDGHGFYKLYNMLSTDTAVEPLCPIRKQEMPAQILEAMGGVPSPMAACPPGFLLRFILGQIRSALFPQTLAFGFDISTDWIAKQKAAGAARNDVSFVSTNDCVVSAFCNCLLADCTIMAVNFRGKIPACKEDDVGTQPSCGSSYFLAQSCG